MEFIKTGRGGRKLLYNEYTYNVDTKINDTTYWRCEKRKVCKGRIITTNATLPESSSDHSHPPDSAHVSVLKALDDMKTRAKQIEEVTSSVIDKTIDEMPLSICGSLPKRETLGRMVSTEFCPLERISLEISCINHGHVNNKPWLSFPI
ncbi:FLYWCH-type zinc finger-containing protein 1-like [Palaemon carinicauda]|uniref:FLYWCH-type zinc finger-containing protein 1-like n=1 Tax=Palaemon carinicauda TaxID=392227 RepID=UPI0035B595E3